MIARPAGEISPTTLEHAMRAPWISRNRPSRPASGRRRAARRLHRQESRSIAVDVGQGRRL